MSFLPVLPKVRVEAVSTTIATMALSVYSASQAALCQLSVGQPKKPATFSNDRQHKVSADPKPFVCRRSNKKAEKSLCVSKVNLNPGLRTCVSVVITCLPKCEHLHGLDVELENILQQLDIVAHVMTDENQVSLALISLPVNEALNCISKLSQGDEFAAWERLCKGLITIATILFDAEVPRFPDLPCLCLLEPAVSVSARLLPFDVTQMQDREAHLCDVILSLKVECDEDGFFAHCALEIHRLFCALEIDRLLWVDRSETPISYQH